MNWCTSQFDYLSDVGTSSFCGIRTPQFTKSTYSFRGMENLHLYLWLLKDLSWAQNWYYSGLIFGSLAVSLSFLLMCNAIYVRATNEIFVSAAIFIW
jgi:hypothetical protein